MSLLAEVRSYWETLRENGRLPARASIDPRGLASALEQVFLIETIAPGHARFRLAGNLFHDLVGMDTRGMPLSALFEPSARIRLQPAVQEMFDGATALHLSGISEPSIGRPALTARMLILPLRAVDGEPSTALGVMTIAGSTGRAPRRFGISALRNESLFDQQVVTRINRKAATPALTAPADPVIPRRSAHPNLRLVYSRDDA